jgi:hypothetical protein
MKLYKRICKNSMCGKEFEGTRTQVYCCPACRVPTYKSKKSKYRPNKNYTLDEITRQAKELGISYGKYVAMQYEKEMRYKKNA